MIKIKLNEKLTTRLRGGGGGVLTITRNFFEGTR